MNRLLTLALWMLLTAAAPLCGTLCFGLWDARLLTMPPRALPIVHPGLSWAAFGGLAIIIAASILPFFSRVFDMRPSAIQRRRSHPAPILKAVCWCILLLCWAAAWTRFEILAPIQLHTFTPLWLSYIALMNVLVYERSGSCPAQQHPIAFALLFPGSAVMWWLFEWLNRFVENWRYENASTYSAFEYVTLATAAFATVLPAVLVTKKFISTLNPFERAFKHWVCLSFSGLGRGALLALGFASLFFVPVWPNILFPLLWISPLLILLGLCSQTSEPATIRRLRVGDWCALSHWTMAGLWCGFLWEIWNYKSLAKWVYEIPYVAAIKIFEMPLLGYAGYLPFGLLCGLLCELLTEAVQKQPRTTDSGIQGVIDADRDILT